MKRMLLGKKKKRPAPPQRLSEQPHKEFEHAMHEYQQTVAPAQSNDDGRGVGGVSVNVSAAGMMSPAAATAGTMMPPILESFSQTSTLFTNSTVAGTPTRTRSTATTATSPQHYQNQYQVDRTNSSSTTPTVATASASLTATAAANDGPIAGANAPTQQQQQQQQHYQEQDYHANSHPYYYVPLEAPMPDTAYEEHYGDAYINAPMKYIYPNGYQSMRPRGGPWKLSIAICILFTWLSVFIVGHCSDRIDESQYNAHVNYNGDVTTMDDDVLVIETRWCGSRLLYFMWVMSMLITGLAAAYCSVIGYIKVRDFAVANARSQPPGVVGNNSDYYVTVGNASSSAAIYNKHNGGGGSSSSNNYYNNNTYANTIYQADGTPQFWGSHIYRPTQAAVAVTTR